MTLPRSPAVFTCALLACASLVVTPATLPAGQPDPARPLNFVVIMADDLGYAGVSCFGNPRFKTPNIDRLAAEGMRLTDFHSSGTACSPTRAGLLTGRYQQRAGIEAVILPAADHPEHRKGLQPAETTFAEVLKRAGYATGLVGKWHQGYPHVSADYEPQSHGFDEFQGYHGGNIDYVSHVGDHNTHDWWHGRARTVEEGYATDQINRDAVSFIERHRDEPFCLYVAHLAIHDPFQARGDPVRRTEEGGWKRWKPATEAERIEMLRGRKGSVYEGGHKVPFIAWAPGRIKAGSENATLPGNSSCSIRERSRARSRTSRSNSTILPTTRRKRGTWPPTNPNEPRRCSGSSKPGTPIRSRPPQTKRAAGEKKDRE